MLLKRAGATVLSSDSSWGRVGRTSPAASGFRNFGWSSRIAARTYLYHGATQTLDRNTAFVPFLVLPSTTGLAEGRRVSCVHTRVRSMRT